MLYFDNSNELIYVGIENYIKKSKQVKNHILKFVNNKFFADAINAYPYYFQLKEREQYIVRKTQQQQEKIRKNRNIIPINFIRIDRVKKFDNLGGQNVMQMWLVDKNTLEIAYHFENDINNEQIYALQQQYKAEHRQLAIGQKTKKRKLQDILFFGRCNFANRTIELDCKSISNKHLILKKIANAQNQTQSIQCFLSCCRQATITKPTSKIVQYLRKLDKETVRTITSYMGQIILPQFQIMDNCSKNGTAFYPKGTYELSKQFKDTLIVSQNQSLGLRVINIIKMTKLSTLTAKIDSAVASSTIQHKNARICGRNIEIENNVKKDNENFQILILRVITPKQHKIYILYSQLAPYTILKTKYELTIVEQNKLEQTDSQKLCSLNYIDSKWVLNYTNSEVFNFHLKKDTNYKIENQVHLRLGKQTKLIINCKLQSSIRN